MSTIVLIQGIEAASAFRTGFTGSKPPQRLGGTEVSNPLSSRGESANHRFRSRRKRGRDQTRYTGPKRAASRSVERWEERAEPCRPEMHVDLIGPDVDALDQGGEEGALACCG